jgi:hypothetical protein
MKSIKSLALLLFLLLLLVACTEEPPQPTLDLLAPTVPAAAATATGQPPVESEPIATPAAESGVPTPEITPATSAGATTDATEGPVAAALPEPSLFDVGWNEREIFRDGLVEQAQGVLNELPGATVYHIDVALSADFTRLEGVQEAYYTNREDVALEELYLRLFPNLAGGQTDVMSVTVNGVPVEPSFELQGSAMRVPLTPALQPGASIVLGLEFAVTIPTEGGGNYGTFVFSDEILALAHFYPMIAVYDDEGWNVEIAPESGDVVYADSSFYIVRVSAPRGLQLVGSGIAIGSGDDGERQEVTFAIGPARDFYLAASEGFEMVQAQVGETTINSYAFPEVAATATEAVQYTVDAMNSFNNRLGPYPYTEFDIVSTATQALGVEYPGVVAINQELYTPSSRFPQGYIEGTVVHEVAHQWFYNVVGNDQLDDPWLDESLVQYVTMLYYLDYYGPAGAEGWRQTLQQRWQAVGNAEIPVGQPVAAYEGPEYSAIVYGRGALFFEELEQVMGEEAFSQFLRDYYMSVAWDIATPEGMQARAEGHCECELDALFNEWIYVQP